MDKVINPRNPRNAGRKPLPYDSIRKRIPIDLVGEVDKLIEKYKQELTA